MKMLTDLRHAVLLLVGLITSLDQEMKSPSMKTIGAHSVASSLVNDNCKKVVVGEEFSRHDTYKMTQ